MTGRPPGPIRVAFPLRIEPVILNAVRQTASDELRSINAQIEILLKEALRQREREVGHDTGQKSNESE
ncbi:MULTISPECIES: hypothetical protein [Rhizobium/Agrobacterium group]|uniref:Arc family DNA-binding protein n=1 Tax=Agrobacterium pusense TaxID=648995 RepID=A0A6H0ZJX2_9HYPH|nr:MULTISPECIES: hypothetical protein [Rhizobium/Agrobacterium group]KGE83823.1 hypothetical protein LW14_04975 [Rhizobium sp. H41]MDH0869266.1 hypothetical protein [Agrobacterium pusense]MDH1267319.1 hypothetical protein [Agrobacterium pusense]MDH2090150.1 hypothetical protein [Agrobacterium pusense]QIX21135.1 hypothetical protein FOB41_08300 [Agrobacterium pusense]